MWKFVVASIGLAFAFPRGTVTAQCADNTCNRPGFHWYFSGVTNSRSGEYHSYEFGMVASGAQFIPAVCVDRTTLVSVPSWVYPSRALLGDTSICTGASKETINFVRPDTAIACAGTVVYGFAANGYILTISAGPGDDKVYSADYKMNVCGGAGSDTLMGRYSYQYISGQTESDFLAGGPNDDNVRGNWNNDIINHMDSSSGGTDQLRGEDGNDVLCGWSIRNSSCGSGNDGWVGTRPSSDCETQLPTCPWAP